MSRTLRLLAIAGSALTGLLGAVPVLAATTLMHPSGLVIDHSGVLWVANSGANQVQSYDISTLPPTPGLAITRDISDPTRLATFQGKIYVANAAANTVTVYNAKSGGEIKSATITGLSNPQGVAVDANGNVFVANSGKTNNVQGYSPQGTLLGTVSGDTTSAYTLLTTLHIQNGTLYVGVGPKVGTDSVREYSAGTFFSGTPTPTTMLTTGISGPTGVVLSRGGKSLLVTNLYADNVTRYLVSTGAPLRGINRDVATPEGIAVDGLGRIFVSNAKSSSISVFTASGVFITSF